MIGHLHVYIFKLCSNFQFPHQNLLLKFILAEDRIQFRHERVEKDCRIFQVHPSTPVPFSITSQLIWREYFYCMSVNNPFYNRMKENPICLNINWYEDENKFQKWKMVIYFNVMKMIFLRNNRIWFVKLAHKILPNFRNINRQQSSFYVKAILAAFILQ